MENLIKQVKGGKCFITLVWAIIALGIGIGVYYYYFGNNKINNN